MNCRGVIRELSNFLDGDLDPAVRAELERHLEHCDDCRMVVDTTRKTVQLFCHSDLVALPEDVRDRLHKALEQKMARK